MENKMYDREERLIEQVERLAAETAAHLDRAGKEPGDGTTLSDIQRAIGARQSVVNVLSPVYHSLRCRAVADSRCGELLPRAWIALLWAEREKDFLLNDLHRLERAAERRN